MGFFFPPDSRLTEISTNELCIGGVAGRKVVLHMPSYSLESSRKEESL